MDNFHLQALLEKRDQKIKKLEEQVAELQQACDDLAGELQDVREALGDD